MFQPGDHVRFRQWDDIAEEFGVSGTSILCPCGFTRDMRPLCGCDVIIESVHHTGLVFLDEYGKHLAKTLTGSNWSYSVEMFEKCTDTMAIDNSECFFEE